MSIKRLRELLDYDPKTGEFRWKVNTSSTGRAGAIAGCLDNRGYRYIRIDGRLLLAHRIAWAMCYGRWPKEIDHKNRDKSDNRIANLRSATRSQNNANRGKRPVGVYPNSHGERWYAKVRKNCKDIRLGSFPTKAAAMAAHRLAHRQIYGEFSRL
jgi:HNH endonuclease